MHKLVHEAIGGTTTKMELKTVVIAPKVQKSHEIWDRDLSSSGLAKELGLTLHKVFPATH